MLALQPVYGWLTSRFRRTVFLPWVYLFFILNIVAFHAWFNAQDDHTWIARVYFVWVSVFNLFVVAVFWSLMADVFTREQAGRLFGFIAAGLSLGGLFGPFLGKQLTQPLGTINLLLVSATLLAVGLGFMLYVLAWHRRQAIREPTSAPGVAAVDPDARLGGSALAAFRQVASSPYLALIAIFVLLLTWVSTFLYLEQQALVAATFADRDARTEFFSTLDFWVQAASLAVQLFLFGRLYRWLGFRALIALVPVAMTLGYVALAVVPTFTVLIGVMVVRRVGEYAIARPSRDTLYTVVTREEKYKAKSLIDTFVYRGGDATSASLHALLKSTFGLGLVGIAWIGAGVAAVWALVAWRLGTLQVTRRRRTEA
jgi:ATP:ADP antiporter, AAA family